MDQEKKPGQIAEEKHYYSFVEKVFNRLAPLYDLIVSPLSRLRNKVVDYTDAETNSKVLDVATGTGKQAYAYAKRGFNVIGIDFSDGMIRVAKLKNKHHNAEFLVGDAAGMPFKDSSFDVVEVSFALHTMPPLVREKALKEMARVTRRKGTLAIIDFALPESNAGRYLFYNIVKRPMGKYFVEFTHSDLPKLLNDMRFDALQERRFMLGGVRILRAVKA